MIVVMPDDSPFTLCQVDQARGDLCAVADEIAALKLQIADLPSRAYVSRIALMATDTVWLFIGVALMLAR
jgi:hypothetical protein